MKIKNKESTLSSLFLLPLLNLEKMLLNTTLKSNSGLYIKANYKFRIENFSEKEESKTLFDKLLS